MCMCTYIMGGRELRRFDEGERKEDKGNEIMCSVLFVYTRRLLIGFKIMLSSTSDSILPI